MARKWAGDVQYRAVVRWTWKSTGREEYKMQGPYDKLGTAEGQLTRMWKEAKAYNLSNKDNLNGWVEKGEVTWQILPNRDAKAGIKLTQLEEELWNE